MICVDMLGEGFDLPELKIAAVHAPHKSLPATLQFIGRFARTNASKLGKAKFLAIPSAVEGVLERLYVEGADWQELIVELTETRIQKEVNIREIIEGFDTPIFIEPDFENISLFSLRPYHHVKVFKVTGEVDLECDLSRLLNPVYRKHNHDMSADLFITRDVSKPKWSISDEFIGYRFNLFIVYYDATTNLLFISASEKSPQTYEAIAHSYSRGIAFPLSLDKVDKVLTELEDFDFWNIGMRNRFAKNNTESYRIMAGESPEKSIQRSDARIFHRGHLFGTARENGNKVTIGYSSSSKVWSHQYESVASLIGWCQKLAKRIDSNGTVKTYSAIDFLSVGKTVSEIPTGPVGVGWHEVVYKNPPLVRYEYGGKIIENRQLLDFTLSLELDASTDDVLRFKVEDENINCSFDFSLKANPRLVQVGGATTNVWITKGLREASLFEFLSLFPVTFFFADFSSLCLDQYYAYGDVEIEPFDGESQMTAIDWDSEGVDIRSEVKSSVRGKTIQEYYSERLPEGDDDIVFLDDSSGEIADFVTFHLGPELITIRFYHCKKAHGVNAVLRDAYDVCGQVLTSLIWVNNRGLLDQILYRERNTIRSKFLKGDRNQLRELLKKTRTIKTRYEIMIVQPGFRKSDLSEEIAHILASADDYIRSALCEPLRIICRG